MCWSRVKGYLTRLYKVRQLMAASTSLRWMLWKEGVSRKKRFENFYKNIAGDHFNQLSGCRSYTPFYERRVHS